MGVSKAPIGSPGKECQCFGAQDATAPIRVVLSAIGERGQCRLHRRRIRDIVKECRQRDEQPRRRGRRVQALQSRGRVTARPRVLVQMQARSGHGCVRGSFVRQCCQERLDLRRCRARRTRGGQQRNDARNFTRTRHGQRCGRHGNRRLDC
eukprot:scaffold136646_cov55-Attheya_sp.AAC.2